MPKSRKRWLLLAVALAAIIYGARSLYLDYRLRTYAFEVFEDIPVPTEAEQISQETFVGTKCRLSRVKRAYASDLLWPEIVAFYKDYAVTNSWEATRIEQRYRRLLSSAQEEILFKFHKMTYPENDAEREALTKGKVIYLVYIQYNQDTTVFSTICKEDD